MTMRVQPTCFGLIIFLVSILIGSCQQQIQTQTFLDYENKKIERKACVGEECASVSISYPSFEDAKLQSLIDRVIAQSMSFEQQPDTLSLDSAVQFFLDEFTVLKADFPDALSWEYAMEVRVSSQRDSLLSLVFDSFSFTGGAHPNSFRIYLNYDKHVGVEITNSELILDEKALLAKTELAFRKYHEVKDGMSLKDDGRFFLNEKDEFFLPVAIGYEGDFLVLYYNPYEIGPYVMGPTEIKLPLDELTGVVAFK
jgi:hypothetical protein